MNTVLAIHTITLTHLVVVNAMSLTQMSYALVTNQWAVVFPVDFIYLQDYWGIRKDLSKLST